MAQPEMYKKWEFNNFLTFVKERKPGRAIIYAKALGIDRRTLLKWMEHKELRDAMVESLDELVEGMQRSGSKDWRMYRELMKMLGVTDEQNIDITSGGEKIEAATIIDLGNLNATNQPEAESSSPDNTK